MKKSNTFLLLFWCPAFSVARKLHIHSITVTTSRTTESRHYNSCHENQHPIQPSVWQLSAVFSWIEVLVLLRRWWRWWWWCAARWSCLGWLASVLHPAEVHLPHPGWSCLIKVMKLVCVTCTSVYMSLGLCFYLFVFSCFFQISSSLTALSGLTWSVRVVSELSYWTRRGDGCLLERATFCYLSVSTTSANRNRRYGTLLTPYFIHNGSVKGNNFPTVLYVSHQLIKF